MKEGEYHEDDCLEYDFIKDNKGHRWQKQDYDGKVLIGELYYDSDWADTIHEGPICVDCDYTFCMWCDGVPDEVCSCNPPIEND